MKLFTDMISRFILNHIVCTCIRIIKKHSIIQLRLILIIIREQIFQLLSLKRALQLVLFIFRYMLIFSLNLEHGFI
jgi:hypothetical protein